MTTLSLLLLIAAAGPSGIAARTPSIHLGTAFDSGLLLRDQSGRHAVLWKETVENQGSSALVGFHVSFNCPHSKALIDHDPLINYGQDFDIPPGGSIEIIAADPSSCPGEVEAAVFSDGHSEGDPVEVAGFYARRRGAYKAIGETIELMDAIATEQKTQAEVSSILDSREHIVANDQTIEGYERFGMVQLFGKIIATLSDVRGVIQSPSDRSARRQPTAKELVREQHVSPAQAQAMVVSRKLQEWRADLADSLRPSS